MRQLLKPIEKTRATKLTLLLSCFVLLVVAVTPFSQSHVSAATPGGSTLTTTPISVDLSASPGTTASTTLQVENNASSPVTITVKLDEFKATGDSGQAQIFTPAASDPASSWVHFSRTSFVAQPEVWNSVTMTINLPKTAAFGYYYAVLFAPNTPSPNSNTVTDTIKGANAVLVLLDAHSPNENSRLSVKSFSVSQSSYQYLPATFNIKVHNDGNVFTIPKGDIYISRTANGPTIDTLDFNSGEGNVLPGTDRVFQAKWSDGFPVYQFKKINGQIISGKNGKPIEQLQWNISQVQKFRFGKYYARFVLVYNNGSRDIPITGEVSFWVMPWLLLIGGLIFSLLVLLGVWTIIRSVVKRLKGLRNRK